MKTLLLSFGLLTLPLAAQGPGSMDLAQAQAMAADAKPYTNQDVGVTEKLGDTIPLDLAFRDEDGKPVRLRELINKPTILSLNYFRCAGICTPQLLGMQDVANKVNAEPGKAFQILTVSFDPRDTPEVALGKRTNYLREMTRPFPPTAWRFLTGEGKDSKALADAVGFHFKQEGNDFAHAGVLMILSPEGKITRYMYGTSYLPADLEMALQEAVKGEARPTIAKWLKMCFTTEAAGRSTVLSVTKISAALLILAALGFGAWLLLRGKRRAADTQGDRP